MMNEFKDFLSKYPWASDKAILVILESHLLIENSLRLYCDSKVKNPQELDKARLTFKQVLFLAKSYQEEITWVWEAVDKLNSLRNYLAHNQNRMDYESKRNEFIIMVDVDMNNRGSSLKKLLLHDDYLGYVVFLVYKELSEKLKQSYE